MQARARLLGHPIHQMLVAFPLGLLPTAFFFDLVHHATGNARWADIAFWLITVGLPAGAVAAAFGTIDWLKIPARTRAWRIGAMHGVGNALVMALFAASWVLRYQTFGVPIVATVCAGAGVALALVTGWLGGELVVRLGIGVDQVGDLNAESSLRTDQPISPSR